MVDGGGHTRRKTANTRPVAMDWGGESTEWEPRALVPTLNRLGTDFSDRKRGYLYIGHAARSDQFVVDLRVRKRGMAAMASHPAEPPMITPEPYAAALASLDASLRSVLPLGRRAPAPPPSVWSTAHVIISSFVVDVINGADDTGAYDDDPYPNGGFGIGVPASGEAIASLTKTTAGEGGEGSRRVRRVPGGLRGGRGPEGDALLPRLP
jgi:hypothetical protein